LGTDTVGWADGSPDRGFSTAGRSASDGSLAGARSDPPGATAGSGEDVATGVWLGLALSRGLLAGEGDPTGFTRVGSNVAGLGMVTAGAMLG
jgi:hypothetical protein